MMYQVVRAKVASILRLPGGGGRPAAGSKSFDELAYAAARHRQPLKWRMSRRPPRKRLVLVLAVVADCGGAAPSGSPRPDPRRRLALTQFPRGKGSPI